MDSLLHQKPSRVANRRHVAAAVACPANQYNRGQTSAGVQRRMRRATEARDSAVPPPPHPPPPPVRDAERPHGSRGRCPRAMYGSGENERPSLGVGVGSRGGRRWGCENRTSAAVKAGSACGVGRWLPLGQIRWIDGENWEIIHTDDHFPHKKR